MTTNVVRVMLPSGEETNFQLTLTGKPRRQEQKLRKLRKYVQQHPSGWKKRLELAELLYSIGEWEKAIVEYNQVLKQRPKLIEIRLQLGKILHLMGLTKQAIDIYEDTLFLCKDQGINYHINGLIGSCRSQYNVALNSIESATTLNPDNSAHWLSLGLTYLLVESPINALRAFEQVLKLSPDDVIALNYNHDALLTSGNIQAAWKSLNKTLDLAPGHIGVLERVINHRLRRRLVKAQEGKKTRQLIRKVMQLAPDSVNIQALLVYYHIFRTESAKATALLDKLIKDYLNNPLGWYYYARFMFHTGQLPEAVTAILKAHKMYRQNWGIYQALCEILPAAGKIEQLRLVVAEMLELFPERWSVWATSGQVLVEHFQEVEQGSRLSAKAIELQPQLADAWFCHGRVLTLLGKHLEAIEVLKEGWQCLPAKETCLQSLPAAGGLAENSKAIGDEVNHRHWWTVVANNAQQLTDFDPVLAYYWQGRASAALGDKTKARQAYHHTLNQHLLYPAEEEVKESLRCL
ncbi:MAG: tetratricopeptide repeat protein [Symploca sp. SIO1C4]|uniref:Tetratricopeptide repeat protein n=1 Tax=Symploca sp. SIO1C4 TaxID=2607765 RepID=A0A6B3N5I5_9CYAN|nr:tetratricopeptide repeat protein [Symploca sp. SIO1C4]